MNKTNATSGFALHDQVYAELVDLVFMFRLPVVIITIVAAAYGWLIHQQVGSVISIALSWSTVLLGTARFLHMTFYKRRARVGPLTAGEARRWDLQFAAGSVLFGLLIGLLCAVAILSKDLRTNTLGYLLCLGYGCGLVSRSGFRSRITAATVAAMMLPVVVSLPMQFMHDRAASLAYTLAIAAFLITFALGGLETSRQAERVVKEHLTTRRRYHAIARVDPLTGAANRLLLAEEFEEIALSMKRPKLALHCIDLDGFKPVNDMFGHAVGDAVLVAATKRLEALLGKDDVLARIGGDEFVILQVIGSPLSAAGLAARILRTLSAPLDVNGRAVSISASVGTALNDDDDWDLQTLMGAADRALYQAKADGKNRAALAA